MNRLPLPLLCLSLVCVLWIGSAHTTAHRQTFHFTGKITKMHDADIMTIRDDKQIEFLIRLKWIDCPDSGQPFFNDAKDMVTGYCLNKDLVVKCDSHDLYGRTFAEVFLPDGRSLNRELVKFGYAWHWKRYSDDKDYADLEAKARMQGRGLWQYENPVQPWVYRRDDTVKAFNPRSTFVASTEPKKREWVSIGTGRQSAPELSAASKTTDVFICKEGGGSLYHRISYCKELGKCEGTSGMTKTSHYNAVKLYGRRACASCY